VSSDDRTRGVGHRSPTFRTFHVRYFFAFLRTAMPTSLSPRSKAKSKASSKIKNPSLDSRQRELLEQQTRLQEQIDELQRVLTDAPKRAVEQKRRVREEAAMAARPQVYRHSATPVDKRHVDEPQVRRSKSRPMLRAERRAAQRQTLALLVVLAAAIIWALHWLVA
jgi:hypothetical protein